MRIYLSSGHRYPAWRYGVAAHVIHDRLARGLAELGHEVRYHVEDFGDEKVPDDIIPVNGLKGGEDILHSIRFPADATPETPIPWVRSVHSDLLDQGFSRERARPNFIFVSQTMARLHDSDRFVWNGLDPADFIYSETKENHFLFVVSGDVRKARTRKGIDIAFWIAKQTGIKLVVAGGTDDPADIAEFTELCQENLARFHYLDMARNYVKEYECEIETWSSSQEFSTIKIPVGCESIVETVTPAFAHVATRPADDREGQVPHQTTSIVE